VRSGISCPKRREDGVWLGMVGTMRNIAERTWGVERERGVRKVTEMVGAKNREPRRVQGS